MPSFAYSAINAQGAELAGEIQAADVSSAQAALRGSGLLAQWIEELKAPGAKAGGMSFGKKKVQAKSLQVFSRQFATMIEAGLSVVTALVILEQQTDDKALVIVIDDLRERVETGALLSEAMALHRDVFSRLYIAMVEAGEAAGDEERVDAEDADRHQPVRVRLGGGGRRRHGSLARGGRDSDRSWRRRLSGGARCGGSGDVARLHPGLEIRLHFCHHFPRGR